MCAVRRCPSSYTQLIFPLTRKIPHHCGDDVSSKFWVAAFNGSQNSSPEGLRRTLSARFQFSKCLYCALPCDSSATGRTIPPLMRYLYSLQTRAICVPGTRVESMAVSRRVLKAGSCSQPCTQELVPFAMCSTLRVTPVQFYAT